MEGVTLIESSTINALIKKIEMLSLEVRGISEELRQTKKPYLNSNEVMELLNRSHNWLNENKNRIGFSKSTGSLLFKRKDVEEFINEDYFKGDKT